ncbi:hypothetical protein C2S53_011491 [Perilla frutescens var. hirtella]|uniref:NPH3 domain-containing protein n=1 Tax=Perilla frutescens var. hirtella TaxID=608512 RepID=A0AAD4P777_PERFH|nr:hypothetical protein C2S53_011491 [Perilla frutescens var. hirtella]
MAATRKGTEFPTSSRKARHRLTSEVQLNHCGHILPLDKNLIALKSATIARQLQKNPGDDVWRVFREIPGDEESMEVIARFCHGFQLNLSTENVVRVACLAEHLGMTDSHCPDNLLSKALLFFEHQVMNSWTNSVKALKSAETVFRQADKLGLIKCCIETLILKALDDPRLLGEPTTMTNDEDDDDDDQKPYRPNTRRKLFDMDWKSEDLTTLPLRLYGPIIHAMIQRQVPQEYVAVNLCQYAKTWIFMSEINDSARRDIIEALVWLLPKQIGLISCTFLCEMLRSAIALDANADCRNGLELRIGLQLDEASTKDLLIPCQGYASDENYDTECLRRILKHFYSNYAGPDVGAMSLVSELIDDLLSEIAADIDLKAATFIAVAEMSIAAAEGTGRSLDGVYKAMDIFLEKRRHLTESEKEDLCSRVLDCNKLSGEALEHAVLNGRLPVRVVMQALFVSQLKLREAIPKALKMEEEEEDHDQMMKTEMGKMGSKVSELERECFVMRREMEINGKRQQQQQNSKLSVWRKMKRKLGCMTTIHDCDCHLNNNNKKKKKGVHPGYTKLDT